MFLQLLSAVKGGRAGSEEMCKTHINEWEELMKDHYETFHKLLENPKWSIVEFVIRTYEFT